jgi:hypothetical protein
MNPKNIRIGISGNNIDIFSNFLDYLTVNTDKIAPIVKYTDCDDYSFCNIVFYYTNLTEFKKEISDKIISSLKERHLFIIVLDDCERIPDELSKYIANIENCKAKICRINISHAEIWKKIDDNKFDFMSTKELNLLASIIFRKSKLSKIVYLRREIKEYLSNIDVEKKLDECGYYELSGLMDSFLKKRNQKKFIAENYLNCFIQIDILSKIKYLKEVIDEIYEIDYLKKADHSALKTKINKIFLNKLQTLFNSVTEYDLNYLNILNQIENITKKYSMKDISKSVFAEISNASKIFIEKYSNKISSITDFSSAIDFLETFPQKEIISQVFIQIICCSKIIQENITKTTEWIEFIDKCKNLEISRFSFEILMEKLIMAKINFNNALTSNRNYDISIVYPYCLQVFLLENLDKNFVFKKLYIYLMYAIKYSGKNVNEYIQNLAKNDFDSLLIIENKIFDLIF